MSYVGYKYIHYQSAPDVIKQIRKEKIYSYESDNLKIERISENYGGRDWKGVYQNPAVVIAYSVKEDGREALLDELKQDGWVLMRVSRVEGFDDFSYFGKYTEALQLSLGDERDDSITVVIRALANGEFEISN
jgi:hypothetical protein